MDESMEFTPSDEVVGCDERQRNEGRKLRVRLAILWGSGGVILVVLLIVWAVTKNNKASHAGKSTTSTTTARRDVYNPAEGRMFASLASMSYCQNDTSILDWTCSACQDSSTPLIPGRIKIVDAGRGNDTRIIIGKLRHENACLVAFRGTTSLDNWLRNFQFWSTSPGHFHECEGCRVHNGFLAIWRNVAGAVFSALTEVGCSPTDPNSNSIYITGHSLGAALAHMAMFTLHKLGFAIAKAYTFESPRVGNGNFSEAFSAYFPSKFPVYRITHSQDPVPHLPPESLGYVHVQTEVFYNKTGGYQVCPKVEDTSCSDQYGNVPLMLALHAGDHCASTLVPNGDICRPIGCSGKNVLETHAT